MSVMPIQKPGRSVQVVGTPRDFLDAVERRFGKLDFDLAATLDNCVVERDGDHHFGPGSALATDSLLTDWSSDVDGRLWLNPEFADIGKWAKKCSETLCDGDKRVFLFVPLTTANWACDFVHGKALVLGLNPRITFVGHTSPYPKDMMLAVYGMAPGFEVWRWKQ